MGMARYCLMYFGELTLVDPSVHGHNQPHYHTLCPSVSGVALHHPSPSLPLHVLRD
ncbi:unnamed protein product, partial [Dovyalis caffra]